MGLELPLYVEVEINSFRYRKTSINLVMQFENGTSLFDKTLKKDQDIFFNVVNRLMEFVNQKKQSKAGKPLTMLVIVQKADRYDSPE